MRCPDCNHNQRYRDGTRCGKCSYQFVFRKKSDGLSDHALRQIIRRLSDNGQYAFTLTQLTLELCRYWQRSATQILVSGLIFVAIISGFVGFFFGSWSIALLLGIILVIFSVWKTQQQRISLPLSKARKLLDRYQQSHPITALADGRAFAQQTVTATPQDLQYAPERILVVERDDLVDMLVRNRFHATHKTVIVSRSGYPQAAFAACRHFLKHHPAIPVQLLHDASLQGFNLKAQLAADTNWPLARQSLVDLGLSQEAIKNTARLPWLPAGRRATGRLSTDYASMLRTGHRMPIDFIGPKPLLNLLGAAVLAGLLALPTPGSGSDSGDGGGSGGDDFG